MNPVSDTARKYLALMEVSRAVTSHRDLPSLFNALTDCLRPLISFHYLSVVLHDQQANVMRVHVLQSHLSRGDSVGLEFALDDSPSGQVFQSQDAWNIRDLEEIRHYAKVYELLHQHEVRSFCSLPLTTAHRRIGALAFGRSEEGGYDDTEMEFAGLVAGQIAVALDNALHYQEAVNLQRELAHERDRLQLVLDVNNSVVANLGLRDLFKALSSSLRKVISYDSASLLVPDAQVPDMLRIHALDFPDGRGFIQQDMLLSMAKSNPGRAFVSGQPMLVGSGPNSVPFTNTNGLQIVANEGLRSSLVLPLVLNGKSVGVLTLGSRTECAFGDSHIQFLQQLARQIAIGVNNAMQHYALSVSRERIEEQKSYLEEEIRAEQDFEDIVGSSQALRSVLRQVDTVAPTDSTVIIEGETGTGKELIARAIHDRSSRRGRTFVKINCAAIPLGLLESELFGHEKGAFTGAIARKIGRFELAQNGTLFLDEIGDIPLELQPKLLRVLQEHEFERLGATRTQKVDVRVIAATNLRLSALVSEGKFRSDLYYRLNIFPIQVPPLRERAEDVPLLARYFTSKYARRMNKRIDRIPDDMLRAMRDYIWPGNVRELQNFIERAVILSTDGDLRAPLSELRSGGIKPHDSLLSVMHPPQKTLRDLERFHILEALQASNWVVGGPEGAASRLGMKRTSLLYRMEKLGIVRHPASRA